MSFDEDFVSKVCNAFKKAVDSASSVTLEGREREFRHVLARYLFDETLGWEGHSKIGEIYDITCFDDENFPIIDIETKWGVEPTPEIKEKLRKRIEELGSVKYGIFSSERDFIVYEYADYKLKEVTRINVAEATGVARGEYGLSAEGKKRILKLEMLKRERLVWIEDPDYFEGTYKQISVARADGVELLTTNLKGIVKDLTVILINFFNSYLKRTDYSGKFLQNAFNDWLKLSIKEEEFKIGDEEQKQKTIELFCRETAYVLVGRILFVRICEDKEILKPSLSGREFADFLKFYEKRRREKVYLRAFEESREEIKKYYSHLHELGFFDWWWVSPDKRGLLTYDDAKTQDSLEEDLNDQVKKCLRKLNRFDFTQVDRDILGDVYQGYLPSDERKRLGEFYTPKEVIEYILDAVDYAPENEIRGSKILDPACGSGGFLVEAVQRLIERYRRLGFSLKDPENAKQIISECVNHIFGLDIHPFACFIAEMNMLFQLVDLYNAVRQKDRYFELPRLNIYRTDSLLPSGEAVIELIQFTDNSRHKMFVEEAKGADAIKNDMFDYVVGNPPYIRTRRMPEEYNRKLRETYLTPTGAFDIYIVFLERSIKWLKKNGKLGFITSNKYFVADYGEMLRGFVLNNCDILQLVDLSFCPDIFKEQFIYPAITILKRVADKIAGAKNVTYKPYQKVKVSIIMKNDMSLLEKLKIKLKTRAESSSKPIDLIINETLQIRFLEMPKYKFEVYALGYDDILSKIKSETNNLAEICKIRGGFMGFEYHIAETCIIDNIPEGPQEYLKIISPSHVRPYEILWKKPTRLFKGIFDHPYIVYDATKISESVWKFFKQKKIVARGVAMKLTAAYDEEGYALLVNIYGIIPNDESLTIEYLLGLLNSKMFDFYHKVHFFLARIPEGSLRYPKSFFDMLPVKLPKAVEKKQTADQISQKARQILQIKKLTHPLETKCGNFPYSFFENDWSFDKLINVVKVQCLSRPSYMVSEKSLKTHYLKDLESKEVFRINLAPNEYVDFSSEEVASYVFEVLKTMNRVTKRELLELKIPTQPYLKELLNQYRKDKEQIVKNEKAVEELEKQVDDLVYKLYDITYTERRTIEDYLKKF